MAVGQAFQHVLEVGERLDAIEFCSGQQRRDGRPARCTAVGTGEEMVLAAKRDRADRSFDRVVVELDASVIEEAAKGAPTGESIQKPKRSMLLAICWTCFFECVRAFLGYGRRVFTNVCSMFIAQAPSRRWSTRPALGSNQTCSCLARPWLRANRWAGA